MSDFVFSLLVIVMYIAIGRIHLHPYGSMARVAARAILVCVAGR
jgi:hypothetical protein